MSSLTTARPVYLGFQTAINVHRLLSIEKHVCRPNRLPLPATPPQRPDLERTIQQLAKLGFSCELSQPLHVLVNSTTRCRRSPTYHPHACTLPLPASCYITLSSDLRCAKPALALVQAATFLSLPALLTLGYELCGTYRRDPRTGEIAFQTEALTSCAELQAFIRKASFLNGAKKVAKALPYLADGSASPRETQAAILFALPKQKGGYGFGTPTMNYEIKATAKARSIAGRSSFRCDLCWPGARLDVEYQSREFHEGETNRIRDSRRTNALIAMGFDVISITNSELESLRTTDAIAATIARKIGKRTRKSSADSLSRKLKLRNELNLPA